MEKSNIEKVDKTFQKVEKKMKKEKTEIGTIDKKVKGQNYVLVHYIDERSAGGHSVMGGRQLMKVWGAFETEPEASEHAKSIQKKIGNEIYDIFVAEIGGLATRPPERVLIPKQVYQEEKLQQIIDENFSQKSKIGEVFDTRLENADKDIMEHAAMKSEMQGKRVLKPAPRPTEESLKDIKNVIKTDRPPTHFDPDSELSISEQLECLNLADKYIEELYSNSETTIADLIKEDVRKDSQNWALVSFTGKNCNQKTDTDGIVFWGVFESLDEAKSYVKEIKDYKLDVVVIEMYTWVVVPLDPEIISSQERHENEIVKIIRQYKRRLRLETEKFNKRKNKLKYNPDINQHYKLKNVFRQIRGEEPVIEEQPKQPVYEDLHKRIFGIPEKLPESTLEKYDA